MAAQGKTFVLRFPMNQALFNSSEAEERRFHERVTDQLKPRIVIPMHYKTPQCAFPIEEVDSFLKGKSKVKKIGDSTVEIDQDSLPDPTEIVVLEPAL